MNSLRFLVGSSKGDFQHPNNGLEPLLPTAGQEQPPTAQGEPPQATSTSYDSTLRPADSNLTERSRSPVEMEPFWVPPIQNQDEDESRKRYQIISVPEATKPKQRWMSPRPFVVYDYLLSALLVYIGVSLIHPSLEKKVSLRALMGAILFQAGLVAGVMAIYTIFSTCGRRCLRWEDILVVLAISVSIYLTQSLAKPWTLPLLSKETKWELFVGAGLLEAVLIHFISRGLFLLPNKDDAIIMLQRQVTSWEESIAVGLAELYFDDCLRRAGRIVQTHHDGKLAVTYRNDDRIVMDSMDVPCIFVAVPRNVDWHEYSFVRQKKELYCQNGLLLPCWIGVNGPSENTPNWLCVSGIKQGYVVDAVPKPLQHIIDNIRRNLDKYTNDDERTEQYRHEARRFTQRLAWLAQKDGLDRYVVIVEFDGDVMEHLPSACSEVFRRQRHVAHWDAGVGGAYQQQSPIPPV